MTARTAAAAVGWRRWWPDTLFSRLAWLLATVVVASHVLALTLMFELRPPPPPAPPPLRPANAPEALHPMAPPAEQPYVVRRVLPQPWAPGPMPPPEPQHRPLLPFLLDVGVRLLGLLAAAWPPPPASWGATSTDRRCRRPARPSAAKPAAFSTRCRTASASSCKTVTGWWRRSLTTCAPR